MSFKTIGAEITSCNVGKTGNYAVQNCTSAFQMIKNTANKLISEIPEMKNIGENLPKILVPDIQPSLSCYVSIINYYLIIFYF
jgi:hypothetical protein